MSSIDPMSSFIKNFASKQDAFKKEINSLSLSGQQGKRFVEAVQEMQREMIAVQISMRTRHGLVKKVMNELR